jgi:hypothetical protein
VFIAVHGHDSFPVAQLFDDDEEQAVMSTKQRDSVSKPAQIQCILFMGTPVSRSGVSPTRGPRPTKYRRQNSYLQTRALVHSPRDREEELLGVMSEKFNAACGPAWQDSVSLGSSRSRSAIAAVLAR